VNRGPRLAWAGAVVVQDPCGAVVLAL